MTRTWNFFVCIHYAISTLMGPHKSYFFPFRYQSLIVCCTVFTLTHFSHKFKPALQNWIQISSLEQIMPRRVKQSPSSGKINWFGKWHIWIVSVSILWFVQRIWQAIMARWNIYGMCQNDKIVDWVLSYSTDQRHGRVISKRSRQWSSVIKWR
jgi:hypothetical protein